MTNNEPVYIVVDKVTEHEDGGATYSFDLNNAALQNMAMYGLDIILRCAAYGVDIQDALDNISTLGDKERSDE